MDAEQDRLPHEKLPGWKGAFWRRDPDPFSIAIHQAPAVFAAGEMYAYSNPGMGALAYAITASLRGTRWADLRTLLERSGAVLVEEMGKLVGIFTERDVLRKLALSGRDPERVPIHQVMTTPVELATPEMSPREALEIMVDRHYRHLPIIDNDGRLLGMLSIRNLLQAQIDELRQQMDSLENYVSSDGPGG